MNRYNSTGNDNNGINDQNKQDKYQENANLDTGASYDAFNENLPNGLLDGGANVTLDINTSDKNEIAVSEKETEKKESHVRYARRNQRGIDRGEASRSPARPINDEQASGSKTIKRRFSVAYTIFLVFAFLIIMLGIVMVSVLRANAPAAVSSFNAYGEGDSDYNNPGGSGGGYWFSDPAEEDNYGFPQQDNAPSKTPDTINETPHPQRSLPQIGSNEEAVIDPGHLTADIAAFVTPSVVKIETAAAGVRFGGSSEVEYSVSDGSGIVLSTDGYIITNQHVIADGDSVYVYFPDDEKKEWVAEVIGKDVIRDLAVIKVERNDCTPARFGDSDQLRPGDTAIAIGNALGSGSGTVTQGIVSAVNRILRLDNGHTQEFIQTDAAINPGNSGGALVNDKGEVFGINTLKSTIAGYDATGSVIAAEGIGYAIPMNDAIEIAKVLIVDGAVKRPALGISVISSSDLDIDQFKELNAPEGIVVMSIVPDGPASKAKLQVEDIITAVNGTTVKTVKELTELIADHKVGDTINIMVWRKGEVLTVQALLFDMSDLDYSE